MLRIIRTKMPNSYKKNGLYHDKVEKTRAYKLCEKIVDSLAKDEATKAMYKMTGKAIGKGYCHIFWGYKKSILKESFGIDWRSPGEMNPDCKFD